MEAKLSRLLDEPEVNPAGDTERALPASMSTLEAGRGFGEVSKGTSQRSSGIIHRVSR